MPEPRMRFRLRALFLLMASVAVSFGSLARGPGTFFLVSTFLFTIFTYYFLQFELQRTRSDASMYGLLIGILWGAAAVGVIGFVQKQDPFGNLGFLIGGLLGGLTALIPIGCLSFLRDRELEALPAYEPPGSSSLVEVWRIERAPKMKMPVVSRRKRRFQLKMRFRKLKARSILALKTGFWLSAGMAVVVGSLIVFGPLAFLIAFALVASSWACYLARVSFRQSRWDSQMAGLLAGMVSATFAIELLKVFNLGIPFELPGYWQAAMTGGLSALFPLIYVSIFDRHKADRSGSTRRRRRKRSLALSPITKY